MKRSEKLDIIIDLYLQGEIDKEDYIRLRKGLEPRTRKLQDVIRELKAKDGKNS